MAATTRTATASRWLYMPKISMARDTARCSERLSRPRCCHSSSMPSTARLGQEIKTRCQAKTATHRQFDLADTGGKLAKRCSAHSRSPVSLFSTCHTLDSGSLGPKSCSADRACPRRNVAEIIEAKRASGCGALCGHRTGIAGGNLNRACPRHNFADILTAKRARGCGAVHGNVLPAQSLGFSLTVESASARVMQWLSLSECTPASVANCWPVWLVANSAPVSLATAAHDRAAAYGTNTRDVFGQQCPPAEFTTAPA